MSTPKKLKRKRVGESEEVSGSDDRNNKKSNQVTGKNAKLVQEMVQIEDPPQTEGEWAISSNRLPLTFFDVPCEELARNLLGKVLVRKLNDGTILKGKIVETESYLGVIDKASQTYQNRMTARNLPMYMPPGTTYVYLTYGMYHCFNISSQGLGCAVLIRALEPLEGLRTMQDNRNFKPRSRQKRAVMKVFKPYELCNGPSKLCMAMDLTVEHNKYSVCTWRNLWIEDDAVWENIQIVSCPRMGIDSAGPEWAGKPLRYYVLNNQSVSKRDKKVEIKMKL